MYGSVAVIAALFVRFAVPETKAHSLEQIEEYCTNGHRPSDQRQRAA